MTDTDDTVTVSRRLLTELQALSDEYGRASAALIRAETLVTELRQVIRTTAERTVRAIRTGRTDDAADIQELVLLALDETGWRRLRAALETGGTAGE